MKALNKVLVLSIALIGLISSVFPASVHAEVLQAHGAGPAATVVKEVEIQPGTMLVAYRSPVTLRSPELSVNVAVGSVGFVIQYNDETAILNLSGWHDQDISVQIGDKTIDVPFDKEILVSSKTSKFEKTALSQCVTCTNPKLLGTDYGINIFSGEFSFQSALDNCPQFPGLLKARDRDSEKVSYELLKNAAALSECGAD